MSFLPILQSAPIYVCLYLKIRKFLKCTTGTKVSTIVSFGRTLGFDSHDYHPPIWYHTHRRCDADCASIYNQALSSIPTARFRTRPIKEPSSLIWLVFITILTTSNDYRRPIWYHPSRRKTRHPTTKIPFTCLHVPSIRHLLFRHTSYGYFVVTICDSICVDCVGTFHWIFEKFRKWTHTMRSMEWKWT